MKYIANGISSVRILLSLSLLLVDLYSWEFIFLYLLCGFSDFLDGYLARRTSTQSILGAKLDTIADMIMFAIVLYIFIPVITLSTMLVIWLLAILAVRLLSMGIVYYKYKMVAMLHTYSNKITGLLLFFIPIFIGSAVESYFIYFVCFIASVSAVEELMINSLSTKMEVNIKSIKTLLKV